MPPYRTITSNEEPFFTGHFSYMVAFATLKVDGMIDDGKRYLPQLCPGKNLGEFMKQQDWLVNSENRLLGLLRLNFPIKSQ